MRAEIGKDKNWEISDVKLLRVTFDNKLNFDSQSHRQYLFESQLKLDVLGKLAKLLSFDKN